ncbi:MAG TPA: hypothetical protein VNP92_08520 [Actinophytocola sp.]|nr:hypothetical protein [Actinophytocola sp.]
MRSGHGVGKRTGLATAPVARVARAAPAPGERRAPADPRSTAG